jgi:hypothetical protein
MRRRSRVADFTISTAVEGATRVTAKVVDGNEREINNGAEGLAERRQVIEGVTEEVLDGEMLRLGVLEVKPHT